MDDPITIMGHPLGWWWSIALLPVGAGVKWIFDRMTGASSEALRSQSDMIARSERELMSRDARIGDLERQLKETQSELNDARKEIYGLNSRVQMLMLQMERAGISTAAANRGSDG